MKTYLKITTEIPFSDVMPNNSFEAWCKILYCHILFLTAIINSAYFHKLVIPMYMVTVQLLISLCEHLVWIINRGDLNIHERLWRLITHPYPNCKGGLATPPLTLGMEARLDHTQINVCYHWLRMSSKSMLSKRTPSADAYWRDLNHTRITVSFWFIPQFSNQPAIFPYIAHTIDPSNKSHHATDKYLTTQHFV